MVIRARYTDALAQESYAFAKHFSEPLLRRSRGITLHALHAMRSPAGHTCHPRDGQRSGGDRCRRLPVLERAHAMFITRKQQEER
ncbi:hypothetical protein HEB94_009217 [Actinopolymorpha pittospori]|uniref:Uncharacterized protein n=1 Tax=Actinopolymorpha pittospori TaxID=648752 RepID=A0A927N5A8_9ACTN|nr:hypothetical protein [Actinopolymorpha pittospori]